MPAHFVAFWNLENLFDVEDSPRRSEKLQRTLKNELTGWTEGVLTRKLDQLARIIRQMNAGAGPDILGVCEIENEHVLQRLGEAIDLPNRTYAVAHADTDDGRGIDVAFLYDKDLYEGREQFSHFIHKRTATRDLFQVTLASRASSHELILIGNHWPARSGGRYESEPYRLMAGENLAYFVERIVSVKGEKTPVLALGDFNDEPFDRSLTDYALGTYQRDKVLNARSPRLYNLMWPLLGQRMGTHYFNNFANMLDQILVARGLLGGRPFTVDEGSVRIENFPEMISGGDYPNPIRFGRPSSGFNPDGFSDHYPVSVQVNEV